MFQYIAISFSPSGQDIKKIFKKVQCIKNKLGSRVELISGFMPRKEVEKNNLDTEIVDYLDFIFPNQLNFYPVTVKKNLSDMRKKMAIYLSQNDGDAYIIGDIKGGALQEYELYKEYLPEENIHLIPLD